MESEVRYQFSQRHQQTWMESLPRHGEQWCYDKLYHWYVYFFVCLIGSVTGNAILMFVRILLAFFGVLTMRHVDILFLVWFTLQGCALGWLIWLGRRYTNPFRKWISSAKGNDVHNDVHGIRPSQSNLETATPIGMDDTQSCHDSIPAFMIPSMAIAFTKGLQVSHTDSSELQFWRTFLLEHQRSIDTIA